MAVGSKTMRIFGILGIALALLIALVQVELWFGRTGMPRVVELESKLRVQRAENAYAQKRNERIAAEVRDLKDGQEMVEEKARVDLGMVKPDEILVQVAPPQR